MSTSTGPSRGRGRARLRTVAAVTTLAVLLIGCGGGNGGGGGGGAAVLGVAFANETDTQATLQLGEGEPVTVESCKGGVFRFDLPDADWILTVNGEPAIDSIELDPNYLGRNMVADLWLNEDGTVDVNRVLPGTNISAPTSTLICL